MVFVSKPCRIELDLKTECPHSSFATYQLIKNTLSDDYKHFVPIIHDGTGSTKLYKKIIWLHLGIRESWIKCEAVRVDNEAASW